jgi:hypothetical protein
MPSALGTDFIDNTFVRSFKLNAEFNGNQLLLQLLHTKRKKNFFYAQEI